MNLRFFRIFNLFGTYVRIFRAFGINVYMNGSWLIALPLLVQLNSKGYFSRYWYAVEYLALILLVLLHELGHALACRSVGGIANRIILWPLGGTANVTPPPRPAFMLWSMAAGPLVNVALLLLLNLALGYMKNPDEVPDDLTKFVERIAWINRSLLIFNLYLIYPLDGGKILWSLLWLVMGRWKSLRVAAVIGLFFATGAILLAVLRNDTWSLYLALFGTFLAWSGVKQARQIIKLETGPKHQDYACPSCHEHPPMAALSRCACGMTFDPFATNGQCPACHNSLFINQCSNCGSRHPMAEWHIPAYPMIHAPSVVPPIPVSRT